MKTACRPVTAASRSTRVIPISASNTLDPEPCPWIVPASCYLRRRRFFCISPFLIFNPSAVKTPTKKKHENNTHAKKHPHTPYNTAVSVFDALTAFDSSCASHRRLCPCCGGYHVFTPLSLCTSCPARASSDARFVAVLIRLYHAARGRGRHARPHCCAAPRDRFFAALGRRGRRCLVL